MRMKSKVMKFKIIFGLFFLLLPTFSFADGELIDKLLGEVEKQYPHAIIIRENNFSDEVRKHVKPSEVINGDFDCNGLQDIAIQIYHDGKIKLRDTAKSYSIRVTLFSDVSNSEDL